MTVDELRFVVQQHAARRMHYDFRLEADGVLISWAVPKGPSFDPRTKRLAVHVGDHELEHRNFEGAIPGARYGAGTVIIWDEGTYRNLTQRAGSPLGVTEAVQTGHLSVWLEGVKLHGGWSLTRTGRGDKEQWIMVKRSDDHAEVGLDITAVAPRSVRSGRTLEEVGASAGAGRPAGWSEPMLAQLVKATEASRVGRSGEWRYERKLDGLRCLAVRTGDSVELFSRNHLSFNARFPHLVAALAQLPAEDFTLDGEVVAFDGDRTSFARLQHRDRSTRPAYYIFDVLHLLGHETTELTLTERQALVTRVLDGAGEGLVQVSALQGSPAELLEQACAAGWEGIVAKRTDSAYRPGRSPDWLKLKCSASQELVIAGWTDPTGSRVGFGALLVGYYDDAGGLRYAGKVGTGFDAQLLRDLYQQLLALASDHSPFAEPVPLKGPHWARPELVGAVSFTEWTADGRLRHPSFQGLRPDKEAAAVRRETPGPA